MASTSPSEFLTFYRYALRRHHGLHTARILPRPAVPKRAITYSAPLRVDQGPDKTHTTRKTDRLDVQNDASHAGRDAKATGSGGTATSQSGAKKSLDKAKKEHPSAPDTAIGMQDERGGKGV